MLGLGSMSLWPDEIVEKLAQNVGQTIFCKNQYLGEE
jgi:hypothetical protein